MDNLPVTPASTTATQLRTTESAGVHTPHHLEDEAQRAALLNALGSLGSDAHLAAIFTVLQGNLAVTGPLTASQASALALMTDAKGEAIRALLAGGLGVTGPLTDTQLAARALATTAKQDTGNTALASILTALTTGIVNAAGENHVGEVGGKTILAAANFTAPAGVTAYAAGQLVANGAAGGVTPMQFAVGRVAGGTGMIRRARLKTTDTGFAGATVRLHLYRDSPTTIPNGDHGAFSTNESNWLGAFDVLLSQTFTDAVKGIAGPVIGGEINFDCAAGSQNVYGLLELRSAVTPQGGKVFTTVLEVLAN